MTIAFGHGLSVAPLQAVMAHLRAGERRLSDPADLPATRDTDEATKLAKRVIKPDTSEKIRYLMRLNVEKGTAHKANVRGYYIGGKTGTAEKVVGGRYSKTKLLTSFTAIMPADKPRYMLLIMLDEPQGLKETHGFATSGWNAVPIGARVVERVAPLLDIAPRFDLRRRRTAHRSASTKEASSEARRASCLKSYAGAFADPVSHLHRARLRQPQGRQGLSVLRHRRGQGGRCAFRPSWRSGQAPLRWSSASRSPICPLAPVFIRVQNVRRALALAAAKFLSAAARDHRCRHRHQRQDLGRLFHPADLDARWVIRRRASARSVSLRPKEKFTAR